MTYEVFSPPRAPSIGPSKSTTFGVIKATFGDGYVARAEDGINPDADSWDLAWNNTINADADTIEAFFRLKRGATPFLYTMPGETTELQWIVSGYKRTRPNTTHSTITATFTRDYTP